MPENAVGAIGATATRGTQAAAPTQTTATTATAAPAKHDTATQTAATTDKFQASGEAHDEGGKDNSQLNLGALTGNDAKAADTSQSDEKKKAEEAKKKEAEQAALEEKKKELEAQIEAKQKELEQAQKDGNQDKVKSLTGELDGLKKQLQSLVDQQQAQAPAAPQAAGAGNQMPAQSSAPVGAAQGGGGQGGGAVPSNAPAGSYPHTPTQDGGWHPPNPTPTGPPVKGEVNPNGTGQDAVNLARKYLGHNAADIKGAMPNFTAAGGQTNNCADFVSSALESTGRINGHHINVRELEKSMLEQGYSRVSKEQAQPGDVWINGSKGHTELVAEAGGNTLIGSNNDRPGHQVISEHRNPSGGYYYHLNKP